MLVPRTLVIEHLPFYRRSRYGLTVTRLDAPFAKAREVATDTDLSNLLFDLGYSQGEVEEILKQLQPREAFVRHIRSLDEFTLVDNGF